MFKVEVDSASNTIFLRIWGNFDTIQGKMLSVLFADKLNEIKPGFKLLTDLSKLKSMDLKAHKDIESIMDLSNKKKVALVVRVFTNNKLDIGFNIMSLFHYSKDVLIQTCTSLEEAKKYLKKMDS